MTKKIIDAHPSVIIAYCKEAKKFLMNEYDSGYSKKTYRLSANLIGGNPEPADFGPENVLIKELSEEIDPNHPDEKKRVGKVLWADSENIRSIRNFLLREIKPFQDFYIEIGEIPDGNLPHKGIYSVFYAEIPEAAVKIVENSTKNLENLTTEGNLRVFNYDELRFSPRKEFSTAHATAPIINYKFGLNIPYPSAVHIEAIGNPKRFYSEYLTDFEYNTEKLKKSARAQL